MRGGAATLGHIGKLDDPLGDGLPDSDTGRAVRERESAYLLGNVLGASAP